MTASKLFSIDRLFISVSPSHMQQSMVKNAGTVMHWLRKALLESRKCFLHENRFCLGFLLQPSKKAPPRIDKLYLTAHVYLVFICSGRRCRSHHPGKMLAGIAGTNHVEKGTGWSICCVFCHMMRSGMLVALWWLRHGPVSSVPSRWKAKINKPSSSSSDNFSSVIRFHGYHVFMAIG